MRSAPWHVKGVAPAARESAQEAARRAGLSLGDWLNTTIFKAAGPHHESRRPPPLDGPGAAPAGGLGSTDLDDRLDQLTQQIDRLVSAATHSHDSVPHRMAQAIGRLDERLDELVRQGRRAADELERRAGSIDRALANLGQDKLRPAYVPAASGRETVDRAVAEISARQRQLDADRGVPEAYAPPPRPPNREAPGPDLSDLQEQLRSITSRIESLSRPCGVGDAVAALRQELADIAGAVRNAMPRRAVEALEGEIRKLAEQVAGGRDSGMGPAALSALERGLADVREALRGLAPAESLAGFEQAIQALTRKIDLLSLGGASGADPAMLGQVESAISTLRGLVGHVASGEALAALAVEVRALGEKIEQVLARPADDLLKTLDRRINAIAEAIEAVRLEGSRAVPAGFEELIRSLNDKIERLQLGRTDQLAMGALEERITRLVEKLDASEARLGHLGAIERGMAELLVHLEEMRAAQSNVSTQMAAASPATATAPPAVNLLRRDVEDIKQTQSVTGRRTEASLEAVHGTIGDVVNRLAMIESDLRTETRTPPPPAPPPQADGDGVGDSAASLRSDESKASVVTPPHAKASAGSTRQPIDPSLPPDFPLEPGSGAPRPRGLGGNERESAPDVPAPGARAESCRGDGGAPNFLEAARRAAKAAALQQKADAQPGVETAASPLSDRLKQLFVGAGVVLAVAGAFRVAGVYLDPDRVILADSPLPRSEVVQATPDLPSAARAIAVPGIAELVPPPARKLPPLTPPPTAIPAGERDFSSAPASGAIAPDRTLQTAATVNPPADITGSVPAIPDTTAKTAVPAPPAAAPPTPAATAAPAPAPASGSGQSAEGITKGLLASASAGNPAASYEIASRYAEGRGVAQSYKDAAVWYERAAKSGLAPAQFRLGTMYEKGLGVQKDLKEARRLYLAAADQQNAKAMHNIAVLYAEGIDGKPDYRSAAQWFRKAAERGITDSQYNLAVLHARGIGVEQDLVQSYKWFALAAAGGDKEAARKRDEVAGRLDPGRLSQAREAVANFSVIPQPEEATSVKMPQEGWDRASRPVAAPGKMKDRAHKQAAVQR